MVMASAKTASGNGDVMDEKELLNVLLALQKGDFSVRMPATKTGLAGKIADTLNEVIESSDKMAKL